MSELLDKLKTLGADTDDVLARFRGNEKICEKIIRKFPADNSMKCAIEAMNNNNVGEAQMMIHTLKGVASNLGLTPIYKITSDMMVSFRAGNPEEAFAKMVMLEQTYNEFVEVIKQ